MENFIQDTADLFGYDPATTMVVLVIISMCARLAGNLIPDDKKGVVGLLRNLLKILGMYASNRVSSGISTSYVTSKWVDSQFTVRDARTGRYQPKNLAQSIRESK